MDQLEFFKSKPAKKLPCEWKLVALRECPMPYGKRVCDTPEAVADYWQRHVATTPHFNPDCECLVVLHLDVRRRVKGHHLVSIGLLDTVLVHPREAFRVAIVAAAHAVILMHNHPSGDPTPSEADIKATRELVRAGKMLRIEVLDHVIVGLWDHRSLRTLGYIWE